MTIRRSYVLAFLAVLAGGCGTGKKPNTTKTEEGGGWMLPSLVRVAPTAPDAVVFAAVRLETTPEPTLELLDGSGSVVTRTDLSLPWPECRTTIAIALGDVDEDGHEDVVALDALCGAWAAPLPHDDTATLAAKRNLLAQLAPNAYLIHEDIDGDAVSDWASANPRSLSGLLKRDAGWTGFEVSFAGISDINQNLASNLTIPINTPHQRGFLFQQLRYLSVLQLSDTEGGLIEGTRLLQEALEYRAPFDQYDQLTPLSPVVDCSAFAVATGVFLDANVPMPTVVLATTGASTYSAQKSTSTFRETLLLGRAVWKDQEFLGIVGLRHSGKAGVIVARRSGCTDFEVLTDTDTVFEPSWLPRPVRTDLDVLHNAGEQLMGYSLTEGPAFCHYDGTSLWCFYYRVSEGIFSAVRREPRP